MRSMVCVFKWSVKTEQTGSMHRLGLHWAESPNPWLSHRAVVHFNVCNVETCIVPCIQQYLRLV